jgi:hypothetical protein
MEGPPVALSHPAAYIDRGPLPRASHPPRVTSRHVTNRGGGGGRGGLPGQPQERFCRCYSKLGCLAHYSAAIDAQMLLLVLDMLLDLLMCIPLGL